MGQTKAQRAAGIDHRKDNFSPEEIDECRKTLGRKQYASLVAQGLSQNWNMTLPRAYRLIAHVRAEVLRELSQQGATDDPITAQFLFLQSIVADETSHPSHRIAASQTIIRLLGLEKFLKKLDGNDVNDFLANLASRSKAIAAAPRADGDSPKIEEVAH